MTCMYHKHPTPTSSMCQTNNIFSHSSLQSYSRAVSSQKPSNAIFSACQQLINMDFIPRMSVCKMQTRLNRERLGNNMSRVGWGCGAEISGVECLIRRILLVGFLSLGSVVSAVQSRHHLASWNATEQGVEGSPML